MDMSSGAAASTDLSAYGALLRRRWWIILTCALAGVVLAAGFAFLQPRMYTSTSSVLVTATGVESSTEITGGRNRTKINLDTQAQVAQSAEVARRAKRLMKSSLPPDELLEQVSVKVPPNSAVLAISYEATSPQAAKQGAHAFATAYLKNRYETARATITQKVRNLQKQLSTATRQLQQVTAKLAGLSSDSATYALTKSEQERIAGQIATLESDISALRTTTITPGRVISGARLPTGPTSPVVWLYLVSGLMAGLLLGVLAALLRDRADRRVRRAEDVERMFKLPVLVDVASRRQQAGRGLVPARSPAGQAFHELCHSLTATLGHGNHAVLVTGSTAGRGASFTAANLAAVLARTETNVALVCADLQSTATTRLLGLEDGPGLSDVLLYGAKVSEVEQRPAGYPRLRVIAPGLDGELAWERLQTHSMDDFVAELRRTATYVLIEAPPTSASADALALAEASDAALVVIDVPRADRKQVREGISQIDRVGTIVIGSVVVPSHSGGNGTDTAPTRRARGEPSTPPLPAPPAPAAQQAAPPSAPSAQAAHPGRTAPMQAVGNRGTSRTGRPAPDGHGGQERESTARHGARGAQDDARAGSHQPPEEPRDSDHRRGDRSQEGRYDFSYESYAGSSEPPLGGASDTPDYGDVYGALGRDSYSSYDSHGDGSRSGTGRGTNQQPGS